MNKTLYIQDEDGPIWDRARELTGEKLSSFIMERLRVFVSEHEAAQRGYERIVLRMYTDGLPKAIAFHGRWIIAPSEPVVVENRVPETLGDMIAQRPEIAGSYAVAQTQKEKFLVVRFLKGEAGSEDHILHDALFWVIKSLHEAPSMIPRTILAEAIERLGIVVQELDI